MRTAGRFGLIAILMLLGAGVVYAQDPSPETPTAESGKPEPKKSEPPADTDTRSFRPSEEVSADAEVDFPADI